MAKIYLSSTWADLVEHREAVYRALRQMRHDVLAMEDYGAADDRPLDRCLTDVAASDVYVGIFAWRYGFVPEGESRAITHLEYDHAGSAGLPRLVFLAAEDAPWPPNRMDADLGAVRRLRARLQLDHVVSFFDSPDDLARSVSVAVANTLETARAVPGGSAENANAEFLRRSLSRLTHDLDAGVRFYSQLGLGVFGLGVLLLVAGAVTANLMLALGSALVIAFALYPLTTMISTRRKKDVLNGYAHALVGSTPPPETLAIVHRFLSEQLAA